MFRVAVYDTNSNMSSTEVFSDLTVAQYAAAAGLSYLSWFIVPYLRDPFDYRRRFSGPPLAALTNLWLSHLALSGRRSEIIHELHRKYGKFVRIGPNHISIADPAALEAVYSHGSGLLKTDFYQAFVVTGTDVFSEQTKSVHTMKRKRVANMFSLQNVLAFEPRVHRYVRQLCRQWDMRCDEAARGNAGVNWDAKDGRALLDCSAQFAYLSFDIISDLALGTPFGMVEAQKDSAPVAQAIAASYDESVTTGNVSIIKTMDQGSRFVTSAGFLPTWLRPLLKFSPWHSKDSRAPLDMMGIVMASLNSRLHRGRQGDDDAEGDQKPIVDMIDKLLEARDENGQPLSKDEIIAEAMIMLGAGSDTTSNSLGAICYYLAKNPRVQRLLQAELDAQILKDSNNTADPVISFEQVKNLPYLNACIKEAMRLHTTVGGGLPRIVPPGKTFKFGGEVFKEGSIISVPMYSVNRSELWGDDAEEFRPERWLEDESNKVNKFFMPFSTGSRACVGRNLADMNILISTATIFNRYDIALQDPNDTLHCHENFVRDTYECNVAIRRREMKISS